LGDVTVHTATPILTTTSEDEDTWVEGEPDETTSFGVVFDCFYMHGRGATEQPAVPRGRRKVEGPTIIYESERDDGSIVQLVAEDEVVIDPGDDEGIWAVLGGEGQTVKVGNEEIPGVRFQVDGDPEPFQPPGEVLGFQARLKRVVD
jgi:hypothetical protein